MLGKLEIVYINCNSYTQFFVEQEKEILPIQQKNNVAQKWRFLC